MAAVGVGAELYLVHRQKLHRPVERHGLHRAGEPFGTRRHDFFLAGDEGDIADALGRHHAVVILPREQAERKTDDAGVMGKKPLHGEMRLACIGRPQHGFDTWLEG